MIVQSTEQASSKNLDTFSDEKRFDLIFDAIHKIRMLLLLLSIWLAVLLWAAQALLRTVKA